MEVLPLDGWFQNYYRAHDLMFDLHLVMQFGLDYIAVVLLFYLEYYCFGL